ncbi:efflux RND transporter permease subunit [Pseudobacteriovorax antillogorgiicola]|uniref:efflux RND transporter permease subunit n=1 Tax=Pseudobacteriovorax antillogorgiicola TaxID=1513793 RepID=UPI001356532B|nr:efflux RND transporter permease subunit [Pseudobacteriovorax antillogorgiicola]
MIKKFYRNVAAMVMFVSFVILGAVYQFSHLPISLYPATSKPTIQAWLNPQGVDQQEFISNWGTKIESALLNLEGVTQVKGDYYPSSFGYRIEFDWNYDPNEALADVRSSLGAFTARMPRQWGDFWVGEQGGRSGRILMMSHSKEMALPVLGTLIHQKLVPLISRLEGVENTFVTQRDETEILVELDLEKLYQYRVSPEQVRQVIAMRQFDRKLGVMRFKDGSSYEITGALKIDDLDELRQTIVESRGSQTIRLKDVARVKNEPIEEDEINHANGQRSMFLITLPKPDANLKNVADRVASVVNEFKEHHPEIEIDAVTSPSKFIDRAVRNVAIAVVSAMVIASLIVYLFFGSFRSSMIISLSMPLSLSMTLIIMQAFGVGINLLSLGGMAIAVGMVVDSTIVTLENIVRRLQDEPPTNFEERLHGIYLAVKDVTAPVVASALTTVIVFFPMVFTAPLASAILGDLAIVMVCVIMMSLLVSFLIIPSLFLWTHQKEPGKPGIFSRGFMRLFGIGERAYLFVLNRLLTSKALMAGLVATVLALITASGYLFQNVIQREIMPAPKTDMLILGIQMKNRGLPLEDVEAAIKEYETVMIDEFQDVFQGVYAGIGNHEVWIAGHLKDTSLFDKAKQRMEARFTNQFDYNIQVSSWAPSKLEIPNPPDLRIYVTQDDPDEAREELGRLQGILGQNDKLTHVNAQPGVWRHNRFTLNFEEEQIHRINGADPQQLNLNSVQNLVEYAVDKQFLQNIRIDGEEKDLYMKYEGDRFDSLQDLGNILLPFGEGVLPLRNLVKLQLESQWGHYKNEDGKNAYYLEARVKDVFKDQRTSIIADIKKDLQANKSIDYQALSFADPTIEVDENINSLVSAIVISLALILVVITLQFGTLKLSLIAMAAIPLGFIGVAFSLFLFEEKLSINSMLGLILLCGTAVNNSIIFIDFFMKSYQDGKLTMNEALLLTARLRFKPIMMTTMTTIIGMLPIALGLGSGGEILKSLGVTVSGGLGVSTFLTLLVIPICLRLSVASQEKKDPSWVGQALPTMTGILAVLVVMGLSPSIEAAEAMSLRQAEQRAVDLSPAAQRSRWQSEQATYLKQDIWSESLPSLSYQYQKRQTRPDGETRFGSEVSTHGIIASQALSNPYRLKQRLSGVGSKEDAYRSEYQSELIEAKSATWLAYYEVVYQQKRLESTKTLLETITPRYREQETRYRNGLISGDDLKRFKIQWQAIQSRVAERTILLESAKLELATHLELEPSSLASLSDPFPEQFALASESSISIQDLLQEPKNHRLAAIEQEIQYQDSLLDDKTYTYLPQLSVQYQSLVQEDNHQDEVLLSAQWDLFSGLQDRTAEAKQKWFVEDNKLKLKVEKRKWKLSLIQLWSSLRSLNSQRNQLKNEWQAYQSLVDVSQMRFDAGQISAMQVYNDIEDLIQVIDAYWDVSYKMVDGLSNLSRHTSQPDLFYKMMGLR